MNWMRVADVAAVVVIALAFLTATGVVQAAMFWGALAALLVYGVIRLAVTHGVNRAARR